MARPSCQKLTRRLVTAWAVPPSPEEIAAYAALALALGAEVLLVLARIYGRLGMNEWREWRLFLQLLPLSGGVVAVGLFLFHALPQRDGVLRRDLAWTVALLHLGVLALIVLWLSSADFAQPATWATWSWALGGSLSLSAVLIVAWTHLPAVVARRAGSFSAVLFPGVIAILCCSIPFDFAPPVSAVRMALPLAALLAMVHFLVGRVTLPRAVRAVFDLAILFVVPLTITDPRLPFYAGHSYHYLGPVGSVVAGGTMLVDVWCQYGVWVISFLAQLFSWGWFDLSLFGFTGLLTVLVSLQCLLYYGLFLTLLRSRVLAVVGLLVVYVVVLCGPLPGPVRHPSTGPLRFGLPYVLLGLLSLRDRFPSWRAQVTAAAAAVLGIASLWSIETFVYSAAAFGAFHAYDAARAPSARGWLRDLGGRAFGGVAGIAAFQLFFHLKTYLATESWPRWRDYLDYLLAYSAVGELATLLARPFDPWWALLGLYLLSAVVCALACTPRGNQQSRRPHPLAAGLAGLGLGMLTYFLGRSHWSNLIVVSSPVPLLLAYWVRYFTVDQPVGSALFRAALASAGYGVVAFALVIGCERAATQFESSLLRELVAERGETGLDWHTTLRCAFHPCPITLIGEEVAEWIRGYEPDKRRVAFFAAPGQQAEVLLILRRRHVLPIGFLPEDLYTESGRARLSEAQPAFAPGDYLFVEDGIEDAEESGDGDAFSIRVERDALRVQRDALRRVCKRFTCAEVERWRNYRAIRLAARP